MMNPLEEYRRAQRSARKLFEPFTQAHCPTCATPCCRKPTWVRPTDVVLVEELGYSLPRPEREAATRLVELTAGGTPADEGSPCDYFTSTGCAFPSDLRPFGCAAMICDPMRRTLAPEELGQIERAVERLEAAHAALIEEVCVMREE